MTEEEKNPTEKFLEEVKKRLDMVESDFVQPKFLMDAGIFGCRSAAVEAVHAGQIPHIKISSHRTLIQKEDVLNFLRSKYVKKVEAKAK